MSESFVPVTIRPHLIPYLYENFEGKEGKFCNITVKSARINTSSSLGKYIRMACVKSGKPLKDAKYNFHFTVRDIENSKKFTGKIYQFASGKHSFLMLPEEFIEDLNDLLQDIFETAMFYYIEGYRKKGQYGSFREGLRDFIDKYNLYESGLTFGSLEQTYMRSKKKKEELSRFQRKSK